MSRTMSRTNTLQILSELAADPLWVGCRSYLSWLGLTPPPRNIVFQEVWWFSMHTRSRTMSRSTLCRSYLSWLQILSELAADPILSWLLIYPQYQHTVDPLWVAVDPIWVGCQFTTLPWDQYTVDPLWVGCGSYLSWLSINPLQINTLCILSELAVDPIWVGCWLNPQDQHTADPLWVGCRSYLSWLSIDPHSPPTTYLGWQLIDPPPLPSLPTCQLTELVVDWPPPIPTPPLPLQISSF